MDNKEISISCIDYGKSFDWGKTSEDYAKYRDIYPNEFYQHILKLGLCRDGQRVLDIGTGTGVLPRNMYPYGARWTGTDIAENQIEHAKKLAADDGMDIDFFTCRAEELEFPDDTFGELVNNFDILRLLYDKNRRYMLSYVIDESKGVPIGDVLLFLFG